jgi:mRNA-processing protein COX24
MIRRLTSPSGDPARLGVGLGSVIKKRRKKMRKHKHKKMLKKTRWQRRAHA